MFEHKIILGNNDNVHSVLEDMGDMKEIVDASGIGLWTIILTADSKPRMICSRRMMELLGISNEKLSQEETYVAWFSNVKATAVPSVNDSVREMIEVGKSENTYAWIHPILGERIVRCGGIGKKLDENTTVLRGYHSDVTDIVNKEARQRQQLQEALEEAKIQRELLEQQKEKLQEALDKYREADRDRRTDFLTGLNNRQELYEVINDRKSGVRSHIKAVFMMDIDNFKLYNDHYGHKAGDECLHSIAVALSNYGKDKGVCFYRYGGEEMLGVSFSGEVPAEKIADDLVTAVRDIGIVRNDSPLGVVTISLGYTTDVQDVDHMIDKADSAMYEAKARGKNRYCCFEKVDGLSIV